MEITTIHLDMVQSVALAIVSYYIGMWIKSHSAALQRFSIPAPVIGGLPFCAGIFAAENLRHCRFYL